MRVIICDGQAIWPTAYPYGLLEDVTEYLTWSEAVESPSANTPTQATALLRRGHEAENLVGACFEPADTGTLLLRVPESGVLANDYHELDPNTAAAIMAGLLAAVEVDDPRITRLGSGTLTVDGTAYPMLLPRDRRTIPPHWWTSSPTRGPRFIIAMPFIRGPNSR